MIRVGIIGYSKQKFDQERAIEILHQVYSNLFAQYGHRIEIVSRLTHLGIPGLAYDLAKTYGFRTNGIACRKALEYICFPVDKSLIVGYNWGDESRVFIHYIDWLIRVGGGKQSKYEVMLAKSNGVPVEEFGLTPEFS